MNKLYWRKCFNTKHIIGYRKSLYLALNFEWHHYFFLISILLYSFNFLSNHIISLKTKTSRQEHLSEIVAIILTLKILKKFYAEIEIHLLLTKFTIFIIIHRIQKQKNDFFRFTKQANQLLKLNIQTKRHIFCYVKINFYDAFAALIIFSK